MRHFGRIVVCLRCQGDTLKGEVREPHQQIIGVKAVQDSGEVESGKRWTLRCVPCGRSVLVVGPLSGNDVSQLPWLTDAEIGRERDAYARAREFQGVSELDI